MKKSLLYPKSLVAILATLFVLILSFFVFRTDLFVTDPNQSFLLKPISALILPHHDLAKDLREKVLRDVSVRVNPKTIILVSPNHYDTGGYNILTTSRQWHLTNAYFEPDLSKISKLDLQSNDLAFDREHGIYNLLSPLKNTFPDAKIVPIIIKQDTPASQLDTLVLSLNKVCKADCLVVDSVDFSHYQPASVAQIHDLFSVKALNNSNKDLIWQAEVDSNPTLYLTTSMAKIKNTSNFYLAENTNSGLMEHAPDAESTSYVLGWFENNQTKVTASETFVAVNNLSSFKDPRLTSGVDQKIDLASSRDMALNCLAQANYCGLNRIFWGPEFYRDILNGLVIVGEIKDSSYKLVLVPTKDGVVLRGEEKLAVINKIRLKLGLDATQIQDGYDIINLDK